MARKPKAKTPAKPKAKKKPGRKRKVLTEEAQDKFLKAIRLGCPIKDACGCAGFSEAWFYEEKNRAIEKPQLEASRRFMGFLERIKEVEGEATNRWLAMVEKAAMSGTWQAAAWKLERRRGMTLKVQQEISGPEGGPIKHEVTDAKERLLDKLAQLAAREEPDDVS
jgi:hypothetical protein